MPEKKVFLEVFGANWCSICPHGASKIGEIKDSTDNLLIAVNHINDIYSTDVGAEIYQNYHLYSGWLVSGLIDRYDHSSQVSIDMDRYLWPDYVYKREQDISPVSLFINNVYDPGSKELNVFLSAAFMCDLTGDFRFNCYLVEDSLVAPQDNYLTIPDREPYCYNENWIYDPPGIIQNYVHMNVLRDVLGGPWGSEGSLPEEVYAGSQYDFEYEYTLPVDFDENNIRLIGIVQQYNSDSSKCEILNARSMHLDLISIISSDLKSNNDFIVYPNPAQNQLIIETKYFNNNTIVEIIGIEGRQILRKEISDKKLVVDITSILPGIYLVLVINNNEFHTQKIIIY
jgi:hypothetical protein